MFECANRVVVASGVTWGEEMEAAEGWVKAEAERVVNMVTYIPVAVAT